MSADHHLESLDLFRGLTVAAMILVNNPGDWNTVMAPLLHSAWNGCSAADVIFPFFVFIMGCAMPFAFARRDARSAGQWRVSARIVRRGLTLIALGLALNLVAVLPAMAAVRVPGVLQRLGLTYIAAAAIVRYLDGPGQTVMAIGLLLAHWALLTQVPFGMEVAGSITRTHNLAGYVDAAVFGPHTLTPGFDPEGLLGTATTVATALMGALAARWLRRHDDPRRQCLGLAAAGLVACGTGLVWSLVWPLNKPLWTGSYAVFTSGLAAIALAACLYVADVRRVGGWVRPFVWLGVNPLAIYFCSELVGHLIDRPLLPRLLGQATPKEWLYVHAIAPWSGAEGNEWTSLAYAVAFVSCWIGISACLHRRGVRIRV